MRFVALPSCFFVFLHVSKEPPPRSWERKSHPPRRCRPDFGSRSPTRLDAAFTVLHDLGGLFLFNLARLLHRASRHGVRGVSARRARFPTTLFCPSKRCSLDAASDCSSTLVTRASFLTRTTADLTPSSLFSRHVHDFRRFDPARPEPRGFAPHPEPYPPPSLPTSSGPCSPGLAWVHPRHPFGRPSPITEVTADPLRLRSSTPLSRRSAPSSLGWMFQLNVKFAVSSSLSVRPPGLPGVVEP